MFVSSFALVKWNFITVSPPLEKCVWPHAPFCVDQGFSNFLAHVPLSIKRIISRHLIHAGVIMQTYKQDNVFQFLIDQIMLESPVA